MSQNSDKHKFQCPNCDHWVHYENDPTVTLLACDRCGQLTRVPPKKTRQKETGSLGQTAAVKSKFDDLNLDYLDHGDGPSLEDRPLPRAAAGNQDARQRAVKARPAAPSPPVPQAPRPSAPRPTASRPPISNPPPPLPPAPSSSNPSANPGSMNPPVQSPPIALPPPLPPTGPPTGPPTPPRPLTLAESQQIRAQHGASAPHPNTTETSAGRDLRKVTENSPHADPSSTQLPAGSNEDEADHRMRDVDNFEVRSRYRRQELGPIQLNDSDARSDRITVRCQICDTLQYLVPEKEEWVCDVCFAPMQMDEQKTNAPLLGLKDERSTEYYVTDQEVNQASLEETSLHAQDLGVVTDLEVVDDLAVLVQPGEVEGLRGEHPGDVPPVTDVDEIDDLIRNIEVRSTPMSPTPVNAGRNPVPSRAVPEIIASSTADLFDDDELRLAPLEETPSKIMLSDITTLYTQNDASPADATVDATRDSQKQPSNSQSQATRDVLEEIELVDEADEVETPASRHDGLFLDGVEVESRPELPLASQRPASQNFRPPPGYVVEVRPEPPPVTPDRPNAKPSPDSHSAPSAPHRHGAASGRSSPPSSGQASNRSPGNVPGAKPVPAESEERNFRPIGFIPQPPPFNPPTPSTPQMSGPKVPNSKVPGSKVPGPADHPHAHPSVTAGAKAGYPNAESSIASYPNPGYPNPGYVGSGLPASVNRNVVSGPSPRFQPPHRFDQEPGSQHEGVFERNFFIDWIKPFQSIWVVAALAALIFSIAVTLLLWRVVSDEESHVIVRSLGGVAAFFGSLLCYALWSATMGVIAWGSHDFSPWAPGALERLTKHLVQFTVVPLTTLPALLVALIFTDFYTTALLFSLVGFLPGLMFITCSVYRDDYFLFTDPDVNASTQEAHESWMQSFGLVGVLCVIASMLALTQYWMGPGGVLVSTLFFVAGSVLSATQIRRLAEAAGILASLREE